MNLDAKSFVFASSTPVMALTIDLVLVLKMIRRDGLVIVGFVAELEFSRLTYPFVVEN